MTKTIMSECKHHGMTEFRVSEPSGRARCKKCASAAVSRRRKKLKQMSVEYKGGACEHCGITSEYPDLFDFHHKDPGQKDFALSQRGLTRSWEKIKIELDKCILLCANCHRLEHARLNEQSKNL